MYRCITLYRRVQHLSLNITKHKCVPQSSSAPRTFTPKLSCFFALFLTFLFPALFSFALPPVQDQIGSTVLPLPRIFSACSRSFKYAPHLTNRWPAPRFFP